MSSMKSRRGFLAGMSALALRGATRVQPDLILYNGNVITVDVDQPRAQAVAIAGGRFLAVGSNDEIRERLMPINRKWNLEALIAAARRFPLRNRERLTFEYVLLDDVNDSPLHAREMVHLLKELRCKVNLIALNAGPGITFNTPSDARVQTMQQLLIEGGVPAFIRRPRGRDIYAACGQLKRTVS